MDSEEEDAAAALSWTKVLDVDSGGRRARRYRRHQPFASIP